MALLLETVQREGYRQCPKCRNFIEKKEGCDKVT
jgi:hypothetical protein